MKKFIDNLPAPPTLPTMYGIFWLLRVSSNKICELENKYNSPGIQDKCIDIKQHIKSYYAKKLSEQFSNSKMIISDYIFSKHMILRKQLGDLLNFYINECEKGIHEKSKYKKSRDICKASYDIVLKFSEEAVRLDELKKDNEYLSMMEYLQEDENIKPSTIDKKYKYL